MFDLKISVIVLTFNRKEMLKEALDSILGQSFQDFELIVVDNDSNDGTEKMMGSIKDPRIRYFRNQNNGIIATNLNYGIKKAIGEYIALCDDDDLWSKDKLQKQLQIMEDNPDLAMVATNGIEFDKDGDIGLMIRKKIKNPYLTQKNILIKNIIIQSSVLLRKRILDEVGLFRENPEYLSCEEFELWIRMLKNHDAYVLEEPLMKYRTHQRVFRTRGLKHHLILKRIIDDLWKEGYISRSNYLLAIAKHYVFYAANVTGFSRLYNALKIRAY